MQEAIQKAGVLIEALPYIQSFRNRIVVVKIGGSAIDLEGTSLDTILSDVVLMEAVGMEPILVHGGGQYISKRMESLGLTPRFVDGLRVTDEKTLEIVQDVVIRQVNQEISDRMVKLGGRCISIEPNRRPYIYARKRVLEKEEDLGCVGRVVGVDKDAITSVCRSGIVPVVASLGIDRQGVIYNVNADEVAAVIARDLKAEKCVFLSDVPGILQDVKKVDSVISTLTLSEARALINQDRISAGMIPKINSCIELVQSGVKKTHIVDGRLSHSLLLEIFTQEGIGTQILPDDISTGKADG